MEGQNLPETALNSGQVISISKLEMRLLCDHPPYQPPIWVEVSEVAVSHNRLSPSQLEGTTDTKRVKVA